LAKFLGYVQANRGKYEKADDKTTAALNALELIEIGLWKKNALERTPKSIPTPYPRQSKENP
jgi:hypothetical protein